MQRSRGPSRDLVATLVLALVAVLLAVAPARALPAPLPTSPGGDPPGANDWSCQPTDARPTPVVLVHGTFGDRRSLLERLSQSLHEEGYCVYSLDYGNRGTRDIRESAQQLKAFVDRVLAATGASQVSLVGHSQGGMMPRHYIRFLGGRGVVDDLVGIAPSNHGTEVVGALGVLADATRPVSDLACPACRQQGAGSPFLQRLNHGDETPGPVSYTQITTRYDQVVVPHTSGHLEPGPRTTNITLQELCPAESSEHLLIPTSRVTIDLVVHALGRPGPASPDHRPRC